MDRGALPSVLRRFNPWWDGANRPPVPAWKRTVFSALEAWLREPPASRRATFVSGARQVGKTTLLLQAIDELLERGVSPRNILYATFDHPVLRMSGLEQVVGEWQRIYAPTDEEPQYLFIDEIQWADDWQTWLKLSVDFEPRRRIFFTGSALPVSTTQQETGTGRWHTIKLPTLSFGEALGLLGRDVDHVPVVESFQDLFDWREEDFRRASALATELDTHFQHYLVRGGFPESLRMEREDLAQRHLREDVLERALQRDMTDLFGVRRVPDLEKLLVYLCLHDGGILDLNAVCKNMGVKRETAERYLEVLRHLHLVYLLPRYGMGKEVLRSRKKVYLADAAIAESLLLRGRELLTDPTALGGAVEAAFFRHLFGSYYRIAVGFHYWRDSRSGHEVDVVAHLARRVTAFEVKYSDQGASKLRGLRKLLSRSPVDTAYVITRDVHDLGTMDLDGRAVMRIPAALACYWLSKIEEREHRETAG